MTGPLTMFSTGMLPKLGEKKCIVNAGLAAGIASLSCRTFVSNPALRQDTGAPEPRAPARVRLTQVLAQSVSVAPPDLLGAIGWAPPGRGGAAGWSPRGFG
eukprot:CAMPEP_0204069136 /NCGR_PEP_ID=MMETSP0360-20130528/156453_1 /ASSEMBLY_ACC=CAM_ASM_000342 /TAXON_ID=268821 /ORGANISM="Scrippsiella Hangoei, Strain SHTV-5" /LENGTH=100 /DNA_ID=CAMNT_0051017287 /DNA_START=92 /DNA_END=391 /DNA_ORIENTATION=+